MQADNAQADGDRFAQLRQIVGTTPWLCEALDAVRRVAPPTWYIAAGAVRDTVWNHLTDRPNVAPCGDVDVVYFSSEDSPSNEQRYEERLHALVPRFDWEVTNQATIHLWHARQQGVPLLPYNNIGDALATWPETATAVGIRLDASGNIEVLAPFGLEDLFSLTLRHNPVQASAEAFWARVKGRQWLKRWPELTVVTSV